MKLYEMAFRQSLDKIIAVSKTTTPGRARFDAYAQNYFELLQSLLDHHPWAKIIGHQDLNYNREPYSSFDQQGHAISKDVDFIPWLSSIWASTNTNLNHLKSIMDIGNFPSYESTPDFWWDTEDWLSAEESTNDFTHFLASLGDSSSIRRVVVKQNTMYFGIKLNEDFSVFRKNPRPDHTFHFLNDFRKGKWHYEKVLPHQLFEVVEKYK